MSILEGGKLIALFDQLVSEGILVYGPHESIIREAEGYPVGVLRRTKLARGLLNMNLDRV